MCNNASVRLSQYKIIVLILEANKYSSAAFKYAINVVNNINL
jgi:hypothetical protein